MHAPQPERYAGTDAETAGLLFFQTLVRQLAAGMRVRRAALSFGPRKTKKRKRSALTWVTARSRRPDPKSATRALAPVETDALVQSRAEAEAAVAEARRAHEWLRQAVDLLPQGIVFLDADGRYVLW